MKVVIIGSGNVATILSIKLKNAGHNILQVYNKTKLNAEVLAKKVNALAIDDFSNMVLDAELYIIAVADKAIQNITSKLSLSHKSVVVHTAGAIDMHVLKESCINYGVLYPIQSLHKDMDVEIQTPFAVNASNDFTYNKIKLVIESLNENYEFLTDDKRLQLHVAAVFANNFVNYMYINAFNICNENNIDFNLLHPLINETATRIKNKNPNDVLTGPAVRKDFLTINKHLEVLEKNKFQIEVYQFLTSKIIDEIK